MLIKSDFISTDEDPGLRIESFAIIKLRGVSTKLNIIPPSNWASEGLLVYWLKYVEIPFTHRTHVYCCILCDGTTV